MFRKYVKKNVSRFFFTQISMVTMMHTNTHQRHKPRCDITQVGTVCETAVSDMGAVTQLINRNPAVLRVKACTIILFWFCFVLFAKS